MDTAQKLVTLRDLAKRLRLSQAWLKSEVDAGRIPCLQAGRRRLFNIEAVELALAERAAQGTTGGGSDG